MSIANFDGLAGVTNDAPSTALQFPLGMVTVMGNTSYTYAQATAGAIAAAGTVALTGGFGTTAGSTYTHDVPAPGVPASSYFWAKKVASPF
jgi:hypothetical protein